jgi:hypothetical protein
MDGRIYTGGFESVIRTPKSYNWKPQEDITAHELALCLPILMSNGWDVEFSINALPENARRHFEESK